MYIHLYVYIHFYVCTYKSAYIGMSCLPFYLSVHIHTYIYTYVDICVHMYIYIYTYTYFSINMSMYMYSLTSIYPHGFLKVQLLCLSTSLPPLPLSSCKAGAPCTGSAASSAVLRQTRTQNARDHPENGNLKSQRPLLLMVCLQSILGCFVKE